MTTEATAADGQYGEGLALFERGEFRCARELAERGLSEQPADVNLLRLAGRAGVELNLADSTDYLSKAVELEPGNADAWRELGDAFLNEDRLKEATSAFRQAVELRPNDVGSLVQLAHAAYAAGDPEDAIGHIRQAVERDPNSLGARRALLEIYAIHGMIEAEIKRERWRRALDLAIEATRIDRLGRTTDVLAYVVAQVFGPADRPAPTREEVDDALAASRAEHRRLHEEESLVF